MSPFAQAIIGMTLFTIIDFIQNKYTQRKYAKKCGYNCEICKNWKCFVKYCEEKREELEHGEQE